MNIAQAIAIVSAPEYPEQYVDIDPFLDAFNMQSMGWNDEFNRRVKQRYVETWVGTAVVFFEGIPFAITKQCCRKCDIEVSFLDTPDATTTRKKFVTFLQSLAEEKAPALEIVSMDTELQFRGKVYDDDRHNSIQNKGTRL